MLVLRCIRTQIWKIGNKMSTFGMIMGLVTETDPDEWTEERQ